MEGKSLIAALKKRNYNNIINLVYKHKVKKLLYLASSYVYPKHSDQPMRPEMLMTGSLEPTNTAYATAKLAGIELCRSYRVDHGVNLFSAIPANIFARVTILIKKIHMSLQR